jgi:hypothetical protein
MACSSHLLAGTGYLGVVQEVSATERHAMGYPGVAEDWLLLHWRRRELV